MPRKKSNVKKRTPADVPEWAIRFICTGERPTAEQMRSAGINPFAMLVFMCAQRGDDPVRWGHSKPWFELWPTVKDHPSVIAWKKRHGKTWAERQF